MSWVGHIQTSEMHTQELVKKPEGNRLDNNIKIDLRERGCELVSF